MIIFICGFFQNSKIPDTGKLAITKTAQAILGCSIDP